MANFKCHCSMDDCFYCLSMKKEIIIDGKPFEYESESLTVMDAPVITAEQAKAVLFKAKELLDEYGLEFGLIYGTLLGAIREHNFISHDYDVDVYIRNEQKLLSSIPELDKGGLKLCRVTEGRLYSFRYGKAYIDLYVLRRAPFPFYTYCYFVGSDVLPKKYFDKTKFIDFLGRQFRVPQDAEGLMQLCYGKTWRIPIKGDTGRCNVYPVYLYRKIKKWIHSK